jgi:hypothetical protein
MESLVMLGLHTAAFTVGGRVAKVREVNIPRALVAAISSFIAMFFIGLLFAPISWLPLLGQVIGVGVLFLGSALAAKVVFNCKWKAALMVGAITAAVNIVARILLPW